MTPTSSAVVFPKGHVEHPIQVSSYPVTPHGAEYPRWLGGQRTDVNLNFTTDLVSKMALALNPRHTVRAGPSLTRQHSLQSRRLPATTHRDPPLIRARFFSEFRTQTLIPVHLKIISDLIY